MVVLPQRLYNSSDLRQHPLPQQVEIGAPIHRALNQFQTVDVWLDRPLLYTPSTAATTAA